LVRLDETFEHVSSECVVGQAELPRRGSEGRSNDILSATTQSEAMKTSLCDPANRTKSPAQRQRDRIQQQLLAAEKDEHEAMRLKEKTAHLKSTAAAIEKRLVMALGLANKKELPEELKPHRGDAVVPERVQALRREVRAQTAELGSLSKRWHKICDAAQLVPGSKMGAAKLDVALDDLRQELDKLCGKTLRHRGQIYVRNKEKEQPKANSLGPDSPPSHVADDSEGPKGTVSHLPPFGLPTQTG
jgi:hypothetical protein